MKVTSLPDVVPGHSARHVAIGTFDGVHLGHREVIRGADTVLTFDPHPLAVLRPEVAPKLLDTFGLKRDLIAEQGVEELVVIPFDREFASLEAEDFVGKVLLETLHSERVSVGQNFRFGKQAKGTPELLSSAGLETREVPLVEVDGQAVSSSHIRGLVSDGDVGAAARFLGRPFVFEGEVVAGETRGRELGMPTANIVPDDEHVCPGHGIYAATADGRPAAVNVGVRPQFETGGGVLIEAHLIDFEGDLYGKTMRVAFLERMRGEERFETTQALVDQMLRDVEMARAIVQRAATVARR